MSKLARPHHVGGHMWILICKNRGKEIIAYFPEYGMTRTSSFDSRDAEMIEYRQNLL